VGAWLTHEERAVKRTLCLLSVLGVPGLVLAGGTASQPAKPTPIKPEFTKTTFDAWTAKEGPLEKALRAELAQLDGRIVFAAGLGIKDGKNYSPVKEGDGNWEIYSVRPDGTDLKNLTRSPPRDDYPRVSPDGTRIAFTSDRDLPAGAHLEYQFEALGVGSIVLMNADGSDPKRLCDGVTPAWSRDGKRLAFCRGKQIVIRDLATGQEAVQTPDNWRGAVYPDFASDGVHIIGTGITGRGYHIYGWEFDPVTMARKGEIRQLSSAEGCNAELTPDAKAFLYVQDHGKDTFSRLYHVPIDWAGGPPKAAVRIPTNTERYWEYFPTPSPDGRFLAYSLGASGQDLGEGWAKVREQEIYVAPLAGGGQVRLTFAGLVCRHPNWSGAIK
jgi:Tol biopolymer transport system component